MSVSTASPVAPHEQNPPPVESTSKDPPPPLNDDDDGNEIPPDYAQRSEASRTPKLNLSATAETQPDKVLMNPDAFGKGEGSAGPPQFASAEGVGDSEEIDLAKGRANYYDVVELQKARPADIDKNWRKLFRLVKKGWNLAGKEMSDRDKKSVQDVQDQISKVCRKLALDECNEDNTAFS